MITENIKETWEINPTIYTDGFKCGMVEMFDRFAKMILGKTCDHYDCRKVYVGEKIMELVESYYLEQGMEKAEFGMVWVCYGPKATLDGYKVQVDAGWATDE